MHITGWMRGGRPVIVSGIGICVRGSDRTFSNAIGALTLLTVGVGLAVPARAQAPRLEAELRLILENPILRKAMAGVHVRDLKTGRTLFAHNGARLFNPASNMKLFTTASALWFLGANYKFRTEVRRDRDFKNGVVNGNLYVKGYGDPTLTTEQVFGVVNQIALKGIREVKGDLVVDDTFFDSVFEGPGWDQEHGDHAYAAPVGALSFNFNTFEVHTLPGDQVGAPVRVSVWPDVPSIQVVSTAKTRGRGTRARIWTGTSRESGDAIRVTVRGSMAVNDIWGRIKRSRVHNPSLFAGQMLKQMLQMRGIKVKGRLRFRKMAKRGTVPILTHFSRPLAEIVSTLNKYSNNFMAEQILKTLGAELSDQPGSWKNGSDAVREFLTEIGVDGKQVVLANGSGLNDVNRITPQQVTQVLQAMYKRFDVRPEFVASLAVAGHSGTIHSRFEDSPAQSKLRAKTGSLTGVSALSGYVESKDGKILAFSVMMNDYQGRARSMWRIQDAIGIALARYRSGDTKTGPSVARGSAAP